MLVLTRYAKQGIRIGDDVLVTVLGITEDDHGEQLIRIGIQAPKSKKILREELWNENQVEKADAINKA